MCWVKGNNHLDTGFAAARAAQDAASLLCCLGTLLVPAQLAVCTDPQGLFSTAAPQTVSPQPTSLQGVNDIYSVHAPFQQEKKKKQVQKTFKTLSNVLTESFDSTVIVQSWKIVQELIAGLALCYSVPASAKSSGVQKFQS